MNDVTYNNIFKDKNYNIGIAVGIIAVISYQKFLKN